MSAMLSRLLQGQACVLGCWTTLASVLESHRRVSDLASAQSRRHKAWWSTAVVPLARAMRVLRGGRDETGSASGKETKSITFPGSRTYITRASGQDSLDEGSVVV